MVNQSRAPRIAVLGTADAGRVQACVDAHAALGDVVLVAADSYPGGCRGIERRTVTGRVVCNREALQLLLALEADEVVVNVGVAYSHDEAVQLLRVYAALTGRVDRLWVFVDNERVPLADAAVVPAIMRRPLALPDVHDPLFDEGLWLAMVEREGYDAGERLYEWLRADTVPDLASKMAAVETLVAELRHPFPECAEGPVLALTRMLAREGRAAEAKSRLLDQLSVAPTHRLENALFTIDLVLDGKPVPPHLTRFVGDESSYLRERVCAAPFANFYVDYDGGVSVCCGHFLKTRIGNVLDRAAPDIFNSPVARDIRRSTTDGRYKYCDLVKCHWIHGDRLPLRSDVRALHDHADTAAMADDGVWDALPSFGAAVNGDDSGVADAPGHISLGLDDSCNLRCPSCRPELRVTNNAQTNRLFDAMVTRILPLARDARFLDVDPSGELFASPATMRMLGLLNSREYPRLKINIISNGVLFTPDRWARLANIHDMVNQVRISIDAASKATFETIRLGGQWETLQRNLAFIATLRRAGVVRRFVLSFTYQAGNYTEMPAFVAMTKALGGDAVYFEQLQNIRWTADEFARLAVNRPEHPDYQRFRDLLRHPALQDPIVALDFADP